jgi:hypothetical protein
MTSVCLFLWFVEVVFGDLLEQPLQTLCDLLLRVRYGGYVDDAVYGSS